MKAPLSFVLLVVLAIGCGSDAGGNGDASAAGGAGQGGAAELGEAGASPGAGGAERGDAGGPAAPSMGGGDESGGAVDSGGAYDSGGATQAGAGGLDSAGAEAAPDTCDGKTCNGHGACAAGVCSCETGYAAGLECGGCSDGYTGYPSCVTFPLCKTYENFLDGAVCRGCAAENTTICTSDGAGHDLCFCAKACPDNTCPSLQGVPGQCRSGDVGRCFLSCPIENGGTSAGCPAGFTCRVIAGGGDATCIQN